MKKELDYRSAFRHGSISEAICEGGKPVSHGLIGRIWQVDSVSQRRPVLFRGRHFQDMIIIILLLVLSLSSLFGKYPTFLPDSDKDYNICQAAARVKNRYRGAVNERSLVRQGVRSVMHALRLRGPLATDPTARVLHALVSALAIWFALWSIITLPLYPNLTARLLRLRFVILAELVPATTLILLRLGHFRQAAFFFGRRMGARNL